MTTTIKPTIAATTTTDEITIKAIVQAGIPSSRTSTSALLYEKSDNYKRSSTRYNGREKETQSMHIKEYKRTCQFKTVHLR